MDLLLPTLLQLLQIVLIAALADFVAGLVHWAEDAYFTEDTPIIGPLFIRPNIVHHHLPRYFTRLTWWQSSCDLFLASALLLLGAWACGLLCWQLVWFAVLSINANEIHKWSHRTRAENGRLITKLQDWHLLQTPRHHGLHHTDPKNTYYCPITNFVNPLLERVDFWTRLEAIIAKLTGATHRPDTAVRGQGPGPAWLDKYRTRPAAGHAPSVLSTQKKSAAVALILTFALAGCSGSLKYDDVSDHPIYRNLIGAVYITKEAMNLSGVNAPPGYANRVDYYVIDSANPGWSGRELITRKVLPSGTQLQVVSVYHYTNFFREGLKFRVRLLNQHNPPQDLPIYLHGNYLSPEWVSVSKSRNANLRASNSKAQ